MTSGTNEKKKSKKKSSRRTRINLAATSAFGLPTSFLLKRSASVCATQQVGAPKQKLPVQIGHINGVHVNHVNVFEARQRQILEQFAAKSCRSNARKTNKKRRKLHNHAVSDCKHRTSGTNHQHTTLFQSLQILHAGGFSEIKNIKRRKPVRRQHQRARIGHSTHRSVRVGFEAFRRQRTGFVEKFLNVGSSRDHWLSKTCK